MNTKTVPTNENSRYCLATAPYSLSLVETAPNLR
jgi:hypothetical protein